MPAGEANLFGLHQFDDKDSFFSDQPTLSQGVGYAVVIGYGAFFVVLTGILSFLDQRYGGTKDTSEEFNTAGRSIKTGLVAVDVVSRWTCNLFAVKDDGTPDTATRALDHFSSHTRESSRNEPIPDSSHAESAILTPIESLVVSLTVSVNVAYTYGISGPFWFSSAATVQLIVFAVVALEVKSKAAKAHTLIELIRLRWGHVAGLVFMYLSYLNNIIVSSLLFVGAGSVISAVTGMNLYATVMLLPLGVIIYTFGGGLKATFTSSYLHTIIIYATVNVLFFVIYASNNDPIGTIADVYRNLQVVAEAVPVKGNKAGSYLTMYSNAGLQFGIFNLLGAFGPIFVDQGYWQGAIAATPRAAYRGYILGGLLWFPIPYAFSTALGLGTLGADLPISQKEYGAGLMSVAAAQFFMGTAGVVLMLTVIFMSCTSTGSAQFMAMSSIFTYDIYKTYIRPKATDADMLTVSRASVCVIGLLMGGFSCFCVKMGIDVNFLFFVSGILLSSVTVPITGMIMWKAVPAGAAIASGLGGQICAVIAWLCHTWFTYERLTSKDTLQRIGPALSGTCTGVGASIVILVVWTLVAPTDEDFKEKFQKIELMDGVVIPDAQVEEIQPWFNKYTYFAVGLSVVLTVVWPLLTLPADIFPAGYFTFWVILAGIWTVLATIVATVLPILEARFTLLRIIRNMLGFQVDTSAKKNIGQAQDMRRVQLLES